MKEEIGKRIKEIRENMHMTKEDFAKLLGVSGQYLGVVERGKSCLSVEKLQILCNISNLSADYILFGKNSSIKETTKDILSNFTNAEIENGCNALIELANFIKNSK